MLIFSNAKGEVQRKAVLAARTFSIGGEQVQRKGEANKIMLNFCLLECICNFSTYFGNRWRLLQCF